MVTSENASQRLSQGKEALQRGDFKLALKELSVSISVEPSVEAYFCRAESNFNIGNIEAAIDDVARAEELSATNSGASDEDNWRSSLSQARNRYEGAVSSSQEPPVRETILVLIPTALQNTDEVLARIANRPDFTIDGNTLARTEGTAICDISVHEKNPAWAQIMLEISEGHVSSDISDGIENHITFVKLSAPNPAMAQATKGQVDLATQVLLTLEPLMRALNAPAVLMLNSNAVHTYEEVQELSLDPSSDNMPNAYAKLYNADTLLFSAGMHSLGYPDVEIPYSIMKFDVAVDVLCEFLVYQLINETWNLTEPFEFDSAVTNKTYRFELKECPRFNEEGSARFNANGVWTMIEQIDA